MVDDRGRDNEVVTRQSVRVDPHRFVVIFGGDIDRDVGVGVRANSGLPVTGADIGFFHIRFDVNTGPAYANGRGGRGNRGQDLAFAKQAVPSYRGM